MNNKFPEIKTSKIRLNKSAGRNIKYFFTIYNLSQKEYLDLIGFDHKQKRKDLLFNISRKGNKPNKDPKRKILKLLENNKLTAKQISRLLGIRHSSVCDYLKELKNKRKIKILKKEHWSNIWIISKKLKD